jgi:hypothetical protein
MQGDHKTNFTLALKNNEVLMGWFGVWRGIGRSLWMFMIFFWLGV